MTVPLYIAELSPASQRGMLISMNEVLIVFGILLSFLVNTLLSYELYGWDGNYLRYSCLRKLEIIDDNSTSPIPPVTNGTNAWNSPENAWRWSFGISAVPAVIQFLGLLFLPER